MLNFKTKASYILIADKGLVDWMLSLNTHNRNKKPHQIKKIIHDIKRGDWTLTNQGVGISNTGVLIDGQNRLFAMAELGYPALEILVVTGLHMKAQALVDTGTKRTTGDIMRLILDRAMSNIAIATVNISSRIESRGDRFFLPTALPSAFEVAEYLEKNLDSISAIIGSLGGGQKAAVYSALFDYSEKYCLESALAFASQIKSGEMLSSDDPAYKLRSYLLKTKGTGGGVAVQVETYSHCVSACIAHARQEKQKILRISHSWDRLPKTVFYKDSGASLLSQSDKKFSLTEAYDEALIRVRLSESNSLTQRV